MNNARQRERRALFIKKFLIIHYNSKLKTQNSKLKTHNSTTHNSTTHNLIYNE